MESWSREGPRMTTGTDALVVAVLAEQAAVKQEAVRDLVRAIEVAQDALEPLAGNQPVSGPALRALVTIAVVSLAQAREALVALGAIVPPAEAGSVATGRVS